ncbi:hypothetical protein F5884DRAFT_746295 [Xylogone sp. PMI_703]|nr:hypothetical protein F5884DRAFT_746295 [Xylogone sp. PMI_703]
MRQEQLPIDFPNICFASPGISCHCESCAKRRAAEESVSESIKFPASGTTDAIRSNSHKHMGGASVVNGISRSLEFSQTPPYSYTSALYSSNTLHSTPLCSEFNIDHHSSSIPIHLSSSGYPGGTDLFDVPSVNQDFAASPLGLGSSPINSFSNQNIRIRGRQEAGLNSGARPSHLKDDQAEIAPLIRDSWIMPEFKKFLKAQEYLDLEMRFDNTLSEGQKKPLAEILGISAAQLQSCIKVRHEVLPILNSLMSKMTNLGLPVDYVARWLETVGTQYLTKMSKPDSAYQSRTNPRGDERPPKRRRKLNAQDDSSYKPYQCTHIADNGNYCLQEFNNLTDWKRHEETHWPQKRWECLIQGSNSNVCCHVCSRNIDLAGQELANHHDGCVGTTPRKGHSFLRKDKLKLHVKSHHGCIANVDTWYEDVVSDWKKQCGFCGLVFTRWDSRCEHVGQHFIEGKRMKPEWKDPWPLASDTLGQDDGDDNDDDDDDDDDEDNEEEKEEEEEEEEEGDGKGKGKEKKKEKEEEHNHNDNDHGSNTCNDEPNQNSNNCADNDLDAGSFHKKTSNPRLSSHHERQQHKSPKSGNAAEVNIQPRGLKRQIGEVGNATSPLSQGYKYKQEDSNVFKHIRKLGYGAFGTVDEVEHCASKIHFARKTIRVNPQSSRSSLAQAKREVTVLRRLKHQHIINTLASYSWDGHFSIIMYPVAERNLSEFLLDKDSTTLSQVSKLSTWIGCLTSAVSYMHGHSCYHMDIKPDNILISGSHVVLADFGGSLITEESQSKITPQRASVITPMYCAPEITYPSAPFFAPGASDIFSLGCVLLEMATVIHREKLRTFVDFRTFGGNNGIYSSSSRKVWIWLEHLSYIDESLGLPGQNWLQIIRRMLSIDSNKRPTAGEIVHSYLIRNYKEEGERSDREKYLVISNSNGFLAIVQAARFWLQECRTSHKNCYIPMTEFFPSRILNVDTYSNSIRLQSTFVGFSSPYVTLSHCWGGGEEILKTTRQTLERMTSGIEISSLPATFATAVRLTQALGFKYLWIDALCIIQDSQEDLMIECSQMGKIYSHSSLTISAVSDDQRSPNIEPGVLPYKTVPNKPKALCHSCPSGYVAFESLIENTATTMLLDSPWSRRAWTLQERVLSPRILHFSSTSVAWECCSSCTIFDTVSRIGKALKLLCIQHNTFSDLSIDVPATPAQIPNEYMTIWRDIVREYSRRNLSRPEDKLPALAGIASKISELSGQTYFAGLWKEQLLPTGLLWSRDFATIPLPRPRYRAPSWSWASIDSPVIWSKSLPEEGDTCLEAKIIRCHIFLSSSLSPFGAVSDGYITINGPLQRVMVSLVDSDQLLKGENFAPFAFAQWDALEDEQEISQPGCVGHNKGQMLWCLKLIKGVGLILVEAGGMKPGYLKRVGIFWTREEKTSGSEISDDWEFRTIILV